MPVPEYDAQGRPPYQRSRMTELGVLAHKLLADGQWHDRDTIVAQLMKAVPPGEAYRATQYQRQRMRIARARDTLSAEKFAEYMDKEEYLRSRYPEPTLDKDVVVGKRAIANKAIGKRTRTRYEFREHEGRKQIRLGPMHPRFAESESARLRAQWVAEHGEVKTEEDRKELHRFIHRVQENRSRARKH